MELQTKSIKAHRDFEFNYFKDREVAYEYVYLPNSDGLVVFIAGFGDDGLFEYQRKFIKWVAEKYNFSALFVHYHCINSRPSQNVTFKVPNVIEKFIREFFDDYQTPLTDLLERLAQKKENNKPIFLPVYIVPQNGDYQNFGLLPALDIIYSILDFLLEKDDVPKKVILIGSSYGGYIANLVSKLMPFGVSAVFDNSSWAKINPLYVNGISKGGGEFLSRFSENVVFSLSVISPWDVLFPNLPNYFDENRRKIREFCVEHLKIMAENGGTEIIFQFYHSANDLIAPTKEKEEMVKSMKKLGFNVDLNVMDEKDVDGKFVKNLNHGMGMSLREMFDVSFNKHKNSIIERSFKEIEEGVKIEFPCEDISYVIEFAGNYKLPKMYVV